jgi:amidase
VVDDTTATRSATQLAADIRKGDLTSRALLELYVDRIERLDPDVNAVVTLDVERARAAADDADARQARGDELGPLHGLPITIKDAIATEGIRSTGGALELTDHVPTRDATAVARLKAAGAVVFGKTNLPRWSSDFQTFNDIFGVTRNPWNLERTVGGSSGGAAAAVAAGFTSFELGTDIGGSVRCPSHCCGVYGLKPSFGVIPQRGYLDHVGGGTTDVDINVFGPIARSADDLDLLLGVLAAPEPERAVAWRLELPPCDAHELRDFRVGTWLDDPACPVESESLALLRGAVDQLADAGARVDDDRPPVDFGAQHNLFARMIVAAMSPSLPDDQADAASGSHLAWLRAEAERVAVRRTWADWFAGHDLLLVPVMTTPAFPHDHQPDMFGRTIEIDGETRSLLSTIDWLGLIGIVGLPSAVIPVGRTADGLPVGIQIVAPYLQDRRAIRAAQLAEAVLGGYTPPPGF